MNSEMSATFTIFQKDDDLYLNELHFGNITIGSYNECVVDFIARTRERNPPDGYRKVSHGIIVNSIIEYDDCDYTKRIQVVRGARHRVFLTPVPYVYYHIIPADRAVIMAEQLNERYTKLFSRRLIDELFINVIERTSNTEYIISERCYLIGSPLIGRSFMASSTEICKINIDSSEKHIIPNKNYKLPFSRS